jgi:hypothetical protein
MKDYEWHMEPLDEHGDLQHHDPYPVGSLKKLAEDHLNVWNRDLENVVSFRLCLSLYYDYHQDFVGTVHDIVSFELDDQTFEFNPPLPTKYLQKEFEKSLPIIKKIKFKKTI